GQRGQGRQHAVGLAQEAEAGRVRAVHRVLPVGTQQLVPLQGVHAPDAVFEKPVRHPGQRRPALLVALPRRRHYGGVGVTAVLDQEDRRVGAARALLKGRAPSAGGAVMSASEPGGAVGATGPPMRGKVRLVTGATNGTHGNAWEWCQDYYPTFR